MSSTDGGLTKLGSGALTLSGTNTFNGATAIDMGSIVTGSALSLGSSTLNYNNQGGTLSFGILTADTLGGLSGSQNLTLTNTTPVAVTLTVGNNSLNTTYSGAMSGLGSLVKVGSGTLALSSTSAYMGSTTINNGMLEVEANNALSTGAISIGGTGTTSSASGGTLQLAGGISQAAASITLGTRTDPGSTTASPQIENVLGNNTLSGNVSLTGGGTGATIESDAGTLMVGGNFYNSSGSNYARPIYLYGAGNGALTGVIANSATSGGTTLPNNLSIAKEGSGTWTVSGVNTYTGGTSITAGTLQANNATSALGTGSTTINGTGVLAGTGKTGGAVTVGDGTGTNGTITAGSGTSASTDSVGVLNTGAETWNSGGTYVAKLDLSKAAATSVTAAATNAGSTNDELVMSGLTVASSGTFNINVVSLKNTTVSSGGGTLYWQIASSTTGGDVYASPNSQFVLNTSTVTTTNGGSFTLADEYAGGAADSLDLVYSEPTAAPEPTSALLLGLAALPLMVERRRRGRGQPVG